LVAVSKIQTNEAIMVAYEAGHRCFGENYVQVCVRECVFCVCVCVCV